MKPSKKGCADLHVHTTFSDGTFSPEEVVRRALQLDLKAIAITDHDCIEAIDYAHKAAEGTTLEVIPGVELSAAKDETEIHILGYFIDWKNGSLKELLDKIKVNRVDRMRKMVECLHKEGIDLDINKVLEHAEKGTVGRGHLAKLMVEEGVVRDFNDAFDRYIGDGKSCNVKHKRLDYGKAIDIIKKAGGVPVLAHPGTSGEDVNVKEYADAGMLGIEVYHSNHGVRCNKKYLELAEKFNMVITGGSDCHGDKKGRVLLGTVLVDEDVVETLRGEAERVKRDETR